MFLVSLAVRRRTFVQEPARLLLYEAAHNKAKVRFVASLNESTQTVWWQTRRVVCFRNDVTQLYE